MKPSCRWERDAVGEIANINMGTAATTLSTLLNHKVTITTPRVSYVTMNELSEQLAEATESEVVQVIGSRFVLYKRNPKKPVIDLK